jgi:hypothetical protein
MITRRTIFLEVVAALLVSGSIGAFGCGGEVYKPSTPGPEYERPVVTAWPPATAERLHEIALAQAVFRMEDAGGGSGQFDASEEQ